MQEAIFPSWTRGDWTVTAISDGYLGASLDLLANIETADAGAMQARAGISDPDAIHINCYLVRKGESTILIDAGAGGVRNWGGHLLANLKLAGVTPPDIDTILLTHAHPDHVGGLIDASGQAVFGNAELVIREQEFAFWQDDGNLARATLRAQGNFFIARQAFDGYRRRLRRFDAGEVIPGIEAVALPGHTAGHTGYRLETGNGDLLIWGDIVHFPQIQICRPDVTIAFDHDAPLAAETRGRVLDFASSEHLLIAGMHLGEAGFARIGRSAGTYRITYEG